MNVINIIPLYSNVSVIFNYTSKLSTNKNTDNDLLTFFITDVYTNVTSGVIYSFDARFIIFLMLLLISLRIFYILL